MKVPSVDLSSVCLPSECYPAGCLADEVERQVSLSLPQIDGLCPAMPQDQRLQVLSKTAGRERKAFIALHGGPFGASQFNEPKHDAAAAPHHFTMAPAAVSSS